MVWSYIISEVRKQSRTHVIRSLCFSYYIKILAWAPEKKEMAEQAEIVYPVCSSDARAIPMTWSFGETSSALIP
jgi:hypothetical protein